VAATLATRLHVVRLLRRIAVTAVGTVVLAVAVVLLVTPGPGLLVILLALIAFASNTNGPDAVSPQAAPCRLCIHMPGFSGGLG